MTNIKKTILEYAIEYAGIIVMVMIWPIIIAYLGILAILSAFCKKK